MPFLQFAILAEGLAWLLPKIERTSKKGSLCILDSEHNSRFGRSYAGE